MTGVSTSYRRERSIAVVWVMILTTLLVFSPTFYSRGEVQSVLMKAAPALVAAIGMTLVMLARQIDISVGSVFSLCGVVAGLMARDGWPMSCAALAAILIGGLLGAVNGLLVAVLRLPPIVVTLSTLVAVRETLRWVGQGELVRNLPRSFQWFGLSQSTGQWTIAAIALAVFVVVAGWLAMFSGGRAVYATGSDPEAARLVGIRPRRIVVIVFIACGALTGLAALLNSVRFAIVDPMAGNGFELFTIAAVVVGGTSVNGGRGTLLGTLLGVLLLSTIGSALVFLHVQAHWEKAVQGLIILFAVASDGLFSRKK